MPPASPKQSQTSVAERINELEKQHQQQQLQQQQQQNIKYTYLDPEKRMRVSDPTLKVIQKKALLSFYERHQQASWRSEPHLVQQNSSLVTRHSPPPQPPPRPPNPSLSSRRASCASDYASTNAWRKKKNSPNASPEASSPETEQPPNAVVIKHQHSNSCGSLSTDLVGPVIVGNPISIDDWVPERPPKKPHLRTAFGERLPSPDLPPPSPPTVTDFEVVNCDEPLPPPPPEISTQDSQISDRLSPMRRSSRRKKVTNSPTSPKVPKENGFARSNGIVQSNQGRSSMRYSSSPKLAGSEKVKEGRRASEEFHITKKFSPNEKFIGVKKLNEDYNTQLLNDPGNQRAAPQVPVLNASFREVFNNKSFVFIL